MIVFKCIHRLFNALLQLELSNFSLSILIRIWFLSLYIAPELLSLFHLLNGSICSLLDNFDFVSVSNFFQNFHLVFFKDSVMVKHSQVLDIEDLGHLNSFHSIFHYSIEKASLIIRNHQ